MTARGYSRAMGTRRAFLAGLGDADRAALLALVRRRSHAAGDVLLREGEPGNDVVVVLRGRVKLVAGISDGRPVLLAVRGEDDLLGELSALDGRPRTATAVALEPVDAGYLAATVLRAYLVEHPRAALGLMRLLADRLREADQGRVDLSAHDALGRVAARLLELCERYGEPCEEGLRIDLPITQDDLASWTGSSRQAVARALGLMRSLHWVTTSRRTIVVHDVEALRARCVPGRTVVSAAR
jgi:CRP-like cAMP-binding protein